MKSDECVSMKGRTHRISPYVVLAHALPQLKGPSASRERCRGASSSENGRPTNVAISALAGNSMVWSSSTGLWAVTSKSSDASENRCYEQRMPRSCPRGGSLLGGCTRGHTRRQNARRECGSRWLYPKTNRGCRTSKSLRPKEGRRVIGWRLAIRQE